MPYAMLQKCRNFTMHILIIIIITIIIIIIIIIILFFNLVRYSLLNIHAHCQLWNPIGQQVTLNLVRHSLRNIYTHCQLVSFREVSDSQRTSDQFM